MMECIKLARKGAGSVSPNPLVGCVIVKGNKIIGKGYHRKIGSDHAEVVAVNDAKRRGHSLKSAVVYVNLEPCSHFGKTPPCTDLLIAEGVKKVVIGSTDPNPIVKGIDKLKRAGISVEKGILKAECDELNKFFLKYIKTRIPYITLKIAQSIDGKIANHLGESKYITGIRSRKFVHELRSKYDAVLVGAKTVIKDNPELTVRNVRGRDPLRLIVKGRRHLKQTFKIFNDNNYLILTNNKVKGEFILNVKGKSRFINLNDSLKKLGQIGIASILVEGGSTIFSEFIKYNLADEIIVITAPVIIGAGLSAFDEIKSTRISTLMRVKPYYIGSIGNDQLIIYKCSQV
ncbi:MAG: pyrimidine deaminase [Chlorobi bacterium OLB4]|nr:MAG: pyrimidine deaminase [Chlorobi bacterium OLB4]MBV6398914.1 Riboflavin biosynthesis protein RibD [Ignavibacteria bacterium]